MRPHQRRTNAQRQGLLADTTQPWTQQEDGVVVKQGVPWAKGVSCSATQEAPDGGAHKQRAGCIWAQGDIRQSPLPCHDGNACVEDAKVVSWAVMVAA